MPSSAASLKIASNGDLISHVIYRTNDGKKSEVVPAVKAPSRQLDFPALADYEDLFIYETITLLNPNPTPTGIEIIALDKDGYEIDRTPVSPLSSWESNTISLVDIFGPEVLKDLSMVKVVSDTNIAGIQLVEYPGNDLVGMPALNTASKGWTFPVATEGGNLELWTRVGIINPGAETADINVEAFDANSNSLGVIDRQSLLPGAIYFTGTENIHTNGGIIPFNAAYIKVTADRPISGYEVIGVVNGSGLSAHMGIPEEDLNISGLALVGLEDGNTLRIYAMVRAADGKVVSSTGVVVKGEWSEAIQLPDNSMNSERTILGGANASESLLANTADCFQCFSQVNTSGLPALSWPLEGNKSDYIWYPWDYYPWPVQSSICGGDYKKHVGLDISLKSGSSMVGKKVYPAYIGKVKVPSFNAGEGWAYGVVIEHTDNNNNKFTTTYLHVNPDTKLYYDQKVTTETLIGTVAKTTKPHLHFSIRMQPYKQDDNTCKRGALPIINQNSSCKCMDSKGNNDPVFPEYFVNPAIFFPPDASFTLISPNGGETWQAGTTQKISWDYTGDPGSYVKIELLKAGTINRTITSSTLTSNGYYNWTVPFTQTTGKDYKIKITSKSNGYYEETSDCNFTIGSTIPTITSINPTSGIAGTSVTINGMDFGTTLGTVKFGAAEATVTSWSDTKIVATAPAGSGTVDVTVTTIAGTSNGIPFAHLLSTTVTVIFPNGGENLQAGSKQTITWQVDGDTSNINDFVLAYTIDGGTDYTPFSTVSTSDRTFTVKIPSNVSSTQCKVGVAARDASGRTLAEDASDNNFTVSPCQKPGSFKLTASPECNSGSPQIVLSWTVSSDATSYDLYRNGSPYKTGLTGTQYTDNSVTSGTTYGYYVIAKNTCGSTNSNTVSATAKNCDTTTITVASPNGGETWQAGNTQKITWTYKGNPGLNVKIELLKGESFNRTITSGTSIGNNGNGAYPWTIPKDQTSGSDYKIRITSTNAYTDTSDNNFIISTCQLPGSFTLTASPRCDGSSPYIQLNWTASSGATSYDLYRNGSLYKTGLTSTQYTDKSVTSGTTYSYYVIAKNSCGYMNSNTVSAKALCDLPPPPITDLRATPECNGTTSQIRLNWTASSGATSYDVYRNYSLYYSDVTGTQFINSANITAGVTYTYSVRAKNAYGSSADSNIVSATARVCSSIEVIVDDQSAGIQ